MPEKILKLLLNILILSIFQNVCGYEIPKASIKAYRGNHLTMSIPDEPGIKLVVFHGKLNEPFQNPDVGDFSGEIRRASDGKWTYENKNLLVMKNDNLYYWVFVQHDNLGYIDNEKVFMVREILEPLEPNSRPSLNKTISTPSPRTTTTKPVTTTTTTRRPTTTTRAPEIKNECELSETTVRGKTVCKGQLIFEDNFDTVMIPTNWRREIKMPLDSEDAEFVSYQDNPENLFIENGKLWIIPKLQTAFPGFDEDRMRLGELNLRPQCTGSKNPIVECQRKAQRNMILSPIVSAKLSTKTSFSFRYGRVEIRAKLPKGDWIFPQLFLEPLENVYGVNGFSSGQMRVGFIRGNEFLDSKENTQIDGSRLSGGLILSSSSKLRDVWMKSTLIDHHLSDDFHTYSLSWSKNSISVSLDGLVYANYRPPYKSQAALQNITHSALWDDSSSISPFDKEFYISLGVGVGGMADFPDLSRTGPARHLKPWNNTSPKAELFFWMDKESWYPTWKDNATAMQIDFVKVWAL